jgi:hypothetical protein
MRKSRYRHSSGHRTGLHGGGAVAPREVERGSGRSVATDAFVTLDGEECYRIGGFDEMPPFLMNIPTDTDLWMFVSSAGGLTAGRRDPDGAIFPYETVDRLHDGHHHTGPVTLLRVERKGRPAVLWEPFARRAEADARVERALYKNTTGSQLTFEEVDPAARLAFRSRWAGSDATGWVRTATLVNLGRETVVVSLLDGLRNLLPSGAPLSLYQTSSCLVDAYKRADVDPETHLGIFSLTAAVSDRPEPAEQLRATTAWCHGLAKFDVALSEGAIEAFRRGERPAGERILTGRRGNYLVTTTLTLAPGARADWHIATDTGRSHVQVAVLRARLLRSGDTGRWIEDSLREAGENLRRIVGSADGIQLTGRPEVSARHFANVLFNNLRGGVFSNNHSLPGRDFADFVRARDRALADRHAGLLAALPEEMAIDELRRITTASGDASLQRLGFEYLPLYFGRRHGDPSRPWNRFSIGVRNPDGGRALRFEGNWRDVFQNWEALTYSFPGFLPGVIARFVNASTVDGFNPYRITRDGFDWEVLEPGSPWSGIGYWGDHQVVYLLRLLESMRHHLPGRLEQMLAQECFSYADVPYRIDSYARILADPRSTIRYDEARAAGIAAREAEGGHDARLLHTADGTVYHASLLEKLVVPVLSKLSSLVPDGGIWMNTERPEWNDANNALVGNGLSMVTVYHLRRHLGFLEDLLGGTPGLSVPVSVEVVSWLRRVAGILEAHHAELAATPMDDRTRRRLMDNLGLAFEDYREQVYEHGFAGKEPLTVHEVLACFRTACDYLDHAIRANRREDGLYHSYNLLDLGPDEAGAAIRRLGVMLEGQVAVLGSGLVDSAEACRIVEGLFASPLYREAERSFLLYPNRELPTFLDRNAVAETKALQVPLVADLLAAGDTSVVERDAAGVLRFHADFRNVRDVVAALDALASGDMWAATVARDRQAVCDLFLDTFGHRTFTGRSGTMYAYEGLGSIYWHMVAKLLLAVQEVALRAFERGESPATRAALAGAYYRIRSGLGFEKSAPEFGAFPTDPYSHTPAHAGAQQPGMTGEVKEEILTRFGELGVSVTEGIVRFHPVLLRREEFLAAPGRLLGFGLAGAPRPLDVPARSLAFTYCQVPVLYTIVPGAAWVRVTRQDGGVSERAGARLDADASRALLDRTDALRLIEVGVPEADLLER